MATALRWIPDTLYNYSLAAVVANYNAYQEDTRSFSNNMLFDIYYKLYKEGHLKKLGVEFSDLDVFKKLLNVKDKRCLLHNCFQAVMDHGCPVASELAQSFQTLCTSASNSSYSTKNHLIKLGFSLGRFLLDAGWFPESDIVYSACLSLCYTCDITTIWKYILHCHTKLLYIRNYYCKFEEGRRTFSEANEFIDKIKDLGLEENFASIYSEFSFYYAVQHNYAETYRWSIEALKELSSSLLPKDIVRILCQAAKACILKRKFKRSEMLIKQALRLAKDEFGSRNLCFAAAVEDYGYYLLSVDAIGPAVKAFQTALNLHIDVFGGNNLLVARCHENLAYASYSYGYSSGLFKDAMDHVDKALSIMLNLLDDDNFLLASAKRVKALILEEIALECHDLTLQHKYFAEAQEFHTFALQLALEAFGELNMHTAKHYGNLGRLFQSMKKYKEAQNMQLKAIAIKESVLGPDDYEVGLSIGHLASLYTYDMELHKEAEALFLRSLEISRRLFGEGFSGLEYDYRGLLRVYTKLGLSDKVLKYRTIFHEWKIVRDQTAQADIEFSPLCIESEPIAPEDIMEHFISIH